MNIPHYWVRNMMHFVILTLLGGFHRVVRSLFSMIYWIGSKVNYCLTLFLLSMTFVHWPKWWAINFFKELINPLVFQEDKLLTTSLSNLTLLWVKVVILLFNIHTSESKAWMSNIQRFWISPLRSMEIVAPS